MSGLFNLNVHVQSGWKSSLESICNILRKPRFVVEETFDFKDYEPNINWNGMTLIVPAGPSLQTSRYCIIGKILFLYFDIKATLAAPLTNVVNIDLPEGRNAFFRNADSVGFPRPTFLTYASNASVLETGVAYITAGSNKLNLTRFNNVNYTAGQFFSTANIFLELT